MKPFPYQLAGAEFLASRKRALLTDEPGLGKTAQVFLACRLIKARSILYVCPASLRLNVWREWEKWGYPEGRLVVVSYNFIRKVKRVTTKFDVLIGDESQNIKSWNAQQTVAFIKILAPQAKRIYLLSGSPATKSAADYHPQLSLLEPGVHGKFSEFIAKHCYEREIGYGRYRRVDITGFKNTTSLNAKIKRVSLRRTQEDVLSELPSKRFSTLYLDVQVPRLSREDIDAALAEGKPPPSILPQLRELGLRKAEAAAEYINSFYRVQPLVIFCWFRDTVDYLASNSIAKGKIGFLTGRETAAKKDRYVQDFQAGKLDYLILNIAAAGVGYTLTAARTALFIERPFSPALYEQAWRRIYRIGQTEKVHIVDAVAPDTYDDRLTQVLHEKEVGIEKCLA